MSDVFYVPQHYPLWAIHIDFGSVRQYDDDTLGGVVKECTEADVVRYLDDLWYGPDRVIAWRIEDGCVPVPIVPRYGERDGHAIVAEDMEELDKQLTDAAIRFRNECIHEAYKRHRS